MVVSKGGAEGLLDPSERDSLPSKLSGLEQEIADLQLKLDEPSQKYEAYLRELEGWTQKQATITGDEQTPGTVIYYKYLLDQIEFVPAHLETLIQNRREVTPREKVDRIAGLADTYQDIRSC